MSPVQLRRQIAKLNREKRHDCKHVRTIWRFGHHPVGLMLGLSGSWQLSPPDCVNPESNPRRMLVKKGALPLPGAKGD